MSILTKKLFFISLICTLTCTTCSLLKTERTDGYLLIQEARAAYKLNKLDKAEALLNDAKKADYGFCGNAYIEAFIEIDSLKVLVLMRQKKYSEVRKTLNSATFRGCADYYLIKSLILEFGEEKVFTSFQKGFYEIAFEPEEINPEYSDFVTPEFVVARVPLVDLNIILNIQATSTSFESFPSDPSQELTLRVEKFMALTFDEQKEKFQQSWQFKVLSGNQKLSDESIY